ncbi:hypothetical protein BTJ40_16770 [Microbulbifer sp. A4B17]|nr:hypothetical protein BTJ40_16770 [Microbulbifer sp. A4B17]
MRSKAQEKAGRNGDWTDPEIGPQRVTTGLNDFSEVVAGVEPVSLKEGAVEMNSAATLMGTSTHPLATSTDHCPTKKSGDSSN